jgi:hypothetical protein
MGRAGVLDVIIAASTIFAFAVRPARIGKTGRLGHPGTSLAGAVAPRPSTGATVSYDKNYRC